MMKFEFKNYCELLVRGDRRDHMVASVLYRRTNGHAVGVFSKRQMNSLGFFVFSPEGVLSASDDRDALPLRPGDREQIYELERVHSALLERKDGSDEILLSSEGSIMGNYARTIYLDTCWEYSSEGFDGRIRQFLLDN
jgi:hypothetical protein